MPVIIHIFVLSNRYVSLPVIRLIQKRPTFRLTILSVTKQYLPYFFLTAIWLPRGQLWAIIVGTASLTRC